MRRMIFQTEHVLNYNSWIPSNQKNEIEGEEEEKHRKAQKTIKQKHTDCTASQETTIRELDTCKSNTMSCNAIVNMNMVSDVITKTP